MTTSKELAAIEMVNLSRERAGVSQLRPSTVLSFYARRHARRMAGQGSLVHSSPDVLGNWLTKSGFLWRTWGENVGVTGADIGDLHRAFMKSDGHRANILNRAFRKTGIGLYRDDSGSLWETQVFFG